MNFDEVIDLIKKKQGFTNLDQVANYLELSRGGFLHIKAGRGGLKDQVIEKIMKGSGLEAPEIEKAWKSQFARNDKVRKSWEKWAGAAAFIPLAFALNLSLPTPSSASELQNNTYYVKSYIRVAI